MHLMHTVNIPTSKWCHGQIASKLAQYQTVLLRTWWSPGSRRQPSPPALPPAVRSSSYTWCLQLSLEDAPWPWSVRDQISSQTREPPSNSYGWFRLSFIFFIFIFGKPGLTLYPGLHNSTVCWVSAFVAWGWRLGFSFMVNTFRYACEFWLANILLKVLDVRMHGALFPVIPSLTV